MKTTILKAVGFYSRLFLGIIFVLAALSKVTDPKGFAVLVSNYGILPDGLVIPFSFLISWLELLCGMGLLFGFYLKVVGALTSGLMLIFLYATGMSLFRGLDIDCGCFNVPLFGSPKVGWHTFFRNLIFLAMSLPLIVLGKDDYERN